MLTMAPPLCSRIKGRGRFGAEEWPGEIDRQYPAPSSSDVSKSGANTRRWPAIVDQRVEAAEAPFDLPAMAPATARAHRRHRNAGPSVWPGAASISTLVR